MVEIETIAAIATPPGKGGVGIIRISGPRARAIALNITQSIGKPRLAHLSKFYSEKGDVIDEGLSLYFPSPNSFTGEDVVELHGHGGPVILDLLLKAILSNGVRHARPGEFSERAFLNGKIDLTQAEAVADLIDAETVVAARMAVRSLQGEFSRKIDDLVENLVSLRLYVESAIDFPEDEIDFLSDGKVNARLLEIIDSVENLHKSASIGRVLRDGINLVIAGRPNAGKSSLLNALSGQNSAIVTDIPGTTRDTLKERIQIDGMPVHIIDTAGLRESSDPVEIEGIKRTKRELERADRVLWVCEVNDDLHELENDWARLPLAVPVTLVRNKIDLFGLSARIITASERPEVFISAKQGYGLDQLKSHLKETMHYTGESEFIARRRHLVALERAQSHLLDGLVLLERHLSGELLAEELRLAQQDLNEITGEFSSEDLLGKIFSTFCIGK